jgi:hypothetical protein
MKLALVLSLLSIPIGQGTAATFRVDMHTTSGPITSDQIREEIGHHWDVARACITESDAFKQHHPFKGWERYSMDISPTGRVSAARIEDGYLAGFSTCFKEKVLYKLVFPPVTGGHTSTLTGFTIHANE